MKGTKPQTFKLPKYYVIPVELNPGLSRLCGLCFLQCTEILPCYYTDLQTCLAMQGILRYNVTYI